jgi:hypothetical protein
MAWVELTVCSGKTWTVLVVAGGLRQEGRRAGGGAPGFSALQAGEWLPVRAARFRPGSSERRQLAVRVSLCDRQMLIRFCNFI